MIFRKFKNQVPPQYFSAIPHLENIDHGFDRLDRFTQIFQVQIEKNQRKSV